MSESKHTPGPWEVHSGYLIRKCEGDVCAPIADIRTPYSKGIGIVRGEAEYGANARLIAAAPDLLEALEGLTQIIQSDMDIRPLAVSDNPMESTLAQALTAIAKATRHE